MLLPNTQDQKIARLREIVMFKHADRKAMRHLGAAADELHVEAGALILREGAAFHNVYVITDGRVHVERDGEVKSVVVPGDILGEVALFCHCPASGDIRAATDVEALVIPATRFWQTLHDNPDLATAMAKHLAEELLAVDDVHEGHRVA